ESVGEEQVGRLEVAVHDAKRMGLGDGDARLHHVVGGGGDRQRSVGDHHREVATLEQLHDDVRRAVLELADVGHLADVLAAQPRTRAGLTEEALDDLGVPGQRVVNDLERDLLLELQVGRHRDHAHTAAAEDSIDPELAANDRADLYHASNK